MAYILGFTFADGNVYKTTLAWDLKKDKELLEKINRAMNSNYPILERKASFRLRISNPIIIENLRKLGVYPNKSKEMLFPRVPPDFFSHFTRGFFDGDGWIYIRECRNEISIGFSSGSKHFLEKLILNLQKLTKIRLNNPRERRRITPKGKEIVKYQADYFCGRAYDILQFLYADLNKNDLRLKRKYDKYLRAKEFYEFISSGGRKYRVIQRDMGLPMKQMLSKMMFEEKLNGVQIAERLEVHSSSIYRWLEKTGVRIPASRKKDG
ncbi:hypothetical protein KKI19_03095 [Patescibacteria group bacterium]|nr:hypothetical protein [Patescibacteria group bacterium]